jgi:oligoendopeptidase F
MWKNYQQNPKGTIGKYIDALKMGYTASIGEIYERAGIRFDFSEDYVRELSDFVRDEWKKLL